MKPSEQCLIEQRRRHTEAIVARHLYDLFQRLPMLCGFWLRPDLEVAGISITGPSCSAHREFYEKVMHWLVDLAEERPEAVQFMRGRTFARTLH